MSEFKKYRRTNIAEMRPFIENEELPECVSVSDADLDNGSPSPGDMIARNPNNHDDQWIVGLHYFKDNFEPYNENTMKIRDILFYGTLFYEAGCTDRNCVIYPKTNGEMGTNGGCRCLENFTRSQLLQLQQRIQKIGHIEVDSPIKNNSSGNTERQE